ncbi:MAG TPA: tetratricopeptide repeat protein [Gemmatimonadaceae bacterium]|nr:tetratricopeptide repeat protein [Gemmatimonadaceae bacterium]
MNLAALRHRIILKRGSDLLRKEQWQKAFSALDRAARLAPRHWESHNNLAIALLKLGRFEEAAGVAQRAIRLAPAASDSHDLFGIALLQMERWDEAVVAYRRAIVVDAARYDLYDRLAMALLRLGRWKEVVETYETALAIDANQYQAHHRMGVALLQLRRWDAAAAAVGRAIQLAESAHAPDSAVADLLSTLASAVANTATSADSLLAAHEAVAKNPGSATRLTLGIELLKHERWSDAVSELEDAGTTARRAGCIPFLRVDPLLRLGRTGEAVTAHQMAIAAGGHMPSLPGSSSAERFGAKRETFWTPQNLRADVFAAHGWLEQLSTVPRDVPDGPRLLFVLDNDFGELTTAGYFLLGQPRLAGRTTLLLPERLYAHNADLIAGRTHSYATVDDILRTVDRERAEIVFLCSGYLLWDHLKFTTRDLTRLVDGLRERGCRVVTADPFLGMLSLRDPQTLISIDVPSSHPVWTVEQLKASNAPLEQRMREAFAESERVLRDAYHLYPSYCDGGDDAGADTDARNISFFNEHLLRPAPNNAADTSSPPHWLFILTGADCGVQMLFEGEAGFADIVARKLVEARAAGRHPILIAPADFIARLMPRMPTADGIDILPHCPFTRFMSLLVSAEQVFYWNLVSHSLLIRLYNQQPVVSFDRGHLVRNAPGIQDRLVAWYYQGWEPPVRDQREPLTVDTVERWVADYRHHAGRLVQRFRRAGAPEHIIADLMNAPVRASDAGNLAVAGERSTRA